MTLWRVAIAADMIGSRIDKMIPGSVMEAIRFFGLLALTALVIAANIALVRLIVAWWDSSTTTIGRFVVIQPPKGLENMKDTIGQLLQADVTNAVSQIDKIALFAKSPDALTISQPPVQPAQLAVKFGGVEVSGLAPWLQSLFVSERVLSFVVAFDKDTALVAGDISALSKRKPQLHFEISKPTARKISSTLAYALYQAHMPEAGNREATELNPAEFETVIEAFAAIQELDRQAAKEFAISPDQYVPYLDKIKEVAEKTPNWRGLSEAQAGLAFTARRFDEARKIYAKLLDTSGLPQDDRARYLAQLERLKQFPVVEAPAGSAQLRLPISALGQDQIQALKTAFAKLYQDNTNNGYKFIAGIYSRYAPVQQPEKGVLFLAWHRAYLANLEAALRRLDPSLSVPFWDWTQSASLPAAVQGDSNNPLASGPFTLVAADGKVQEQRATTRQASPAFNMHPSEQVRLLAITDPNIFGEQLQAYHNSIHVLVGGDMATVTGAAYDPLFWFLTANVDRLWSMWQALHGSTQIADNILNQKLEPFDKTVRDVLDTKKLGYSYTTLPQP
jgi:tyrosinase